MLQVLLSQQAVQCQVSAIWEGLAHASFVLKAQARDKALGVRVLCADETRDPRYLEHEKGQLKGCFKEPAREPITPGPRSDVHVNVGACVGREDGDGQELLLVVYQAHGGDVPRHAVDADDFFGPGYGLVVAFKAQDFHCSSP